MMKNIPARLLSIFGIVVAALAAVIVLTALKEKEVELIVANGVTAKIVNTVYEKEDGHFTGCIEMTPTAEVAAEWENESLSEIAKEYSPSISYGNVNLPLPVPGSGKTQNGDSVAVSLEFETWLKDIPDDEDFVEISLPGFEEVFRIEID